ncbi:MAG: hypothetical protein H7210_09080 [Pyrinomonadaceae bacterium]|nr:hypothetical protein [Phycisphaerales bacterium]
MSAIFSPDLSGGQFGPGFDDDPPTVMVPAKRPGVFAVIHVDSRSVFLLVSRLVAGDSFQTLRQEHESFNPIVATPTDPRFIAIKLADILSRFQRIAELHAAAVRAVATQAFRTLPNHIHLLKRLPRITRVALELITDRDVARFVCLGALKNRPPGRRSVVIDMGDDATSIILANAEEPLALWRLPIGASGLVPPTATTTTTPTAKGCSSAHPERTTSASWRRQIQQMLAMGHLATIRGVAREAILIRPREAAPIGGGGTPGNQTTPQFSNPPNLTDVAAVILVEQIAFYLNIKQVLASACGLHEGILTELARAMTASTWTAPPRGLNAPPPTRGA